MNTLSPRSFRWVIAALLLVAAGNETRLSAQVKPGGGDFFSTASAATAADSTAAIIRERFVTLRLDLLEMFVAADPAVRRDQRLSLNLFPDTTFTAVLDGVTVESRDAFVWNGHLEGIQGTATLAVRGAVVAGEVRTANALYEIRVATGGIHVVRQVDPAAFPTDLEPLQAAVSPAAIDQAAAQPLSDDGSRVDVMVLYTPAARVSAGGTAAIEALIDLAIANTNTSYANSAVIQRVRLVHKSEIAYVEAGATPDDFGDDLDALTGTADGVMDNVHAMRNTFRADLVALVINNASSCGLAWLMNDNSAAFAPFGFSVSHHGCIAGNLTLAHEMGHNMSLNHDTTAPPGPFPFTYGRGYNNGSVRDIMAVSSAQPRLQNFSNPAVNFVGTMSPSGTADRNGGLALNNTRVAVSNFRAELVSRVANDHNGDGKSDITWRHADGSWSIWFMDGIMGLGGGGGFVETGYKIVGIGDFNSDGKADVLWRHTTGTIVLWLMDGATPVAAGGLGTIDPSWQIVATGDYNGDGRADILWRHSSGTITIWLMDGGALIGGAEIATVDPSWKIVNSGDFNGDGRADILFRHTTGQIHLWLMNGTAIIGGGDVGLLDPAWSLVGSGDYNGDGRSDFVWRHSSGALAIWFMNGTVAVGGGGITTVDIAWKIVGRGDYNGDGRADLLWRHSSGALSMWLMNGLAAIGGGGITTVDIAWVIVDPGQVP